jgi:hypothetical protein
MALNDFTARLASVQTYKLNPFRPLILMSNLLAILLLLPDELFRPFTQHISPEAHLSFTLAPN